MKGVPLPFQSRQIALLTRRRPRQGQGAAGREWWLSSPVPTQRAGRFGQAFLDDIAASTIHSLARRAPGKVDQLLKWSASSTTHLLRSHPPPAGGLVEGELLRISACISRRAPPGWAVAPLNSFCGRVDHLVPRDTCLLAGVHAVYRLVSTHSALKGLEGGAGRLSPVKPYGTWFTRQGMAASLRFFQKRPPIHGRSPQRY